MQWREFFKDRLFVWSSYGLLAAVFCQLITLVLLWQNLPPLVPIFYSRPWGTEQLADKKNLILLPFLLLFLGLFNIFLVGSQFSKEKLLSRVFLSINILLTLLLTITVFKILFLIVL